MKRRLPVLFLFALVVSGFTQSPRNVVVEHFTNSSCSICASKNPGFYQTMANYPQVYHVTFYPSAPYASCFFSQQNKTEYDARTNYYGAYGATPQVAVNGRLLPISNPLISITALDTSIGKTSPVEVKAYEQLITSDSVAVTLVVKTTGEQAYTDVKIFAGVVEEPVNRTTNNGESVHHDVFRKAITAIGGDAIILPALGDSAVYSLGYKVGNNWTSDNLYSLAFIQLAGTKEIVNVGKSERISIPTGVQATKKNSITIFPNPVLNTIYLQNLTRGNKLDYTIIDVAGRVIQNGNINSPEINVADIATGIYFLKAGDLISKFIKE